MGEHESIHWTDTKEWIPTIKRNNQIINDVALEWNAKGLDDFGVGLQPFMKDAPLIGSDFDTIDCFHPNLASHQGMAKGLWNNMLTSSFSAKATNWKDMQNATCPTPESRLFLRSREQV